jgi:hypothetical protein
LLRPSGFRGVKTNILKSLKLPLRAIPQPKSVIYPCLRLLYVTDVTTSKDYPWFGEMREIEEKESTKCVFSAKSVRNSEKPSGISRNDITVTKDRTEGYL